MKIERLTSGKVLIRPDDRPEKTDSGLLYIPGTADVRPQTGTLLAVAADVDGAPAIGSRVLYSALCTPRQIVTDDGLCVLMRHEDMQAAIHETEGKTGYEPLGGRVLVLLDPPAQESALLIDAYAPVSRTGTVLAIAGDADDEVEAGQRVVVNLRAPHRRMALASGEAMLGQPFGAHAPEDLILGTLEG